MEKRILGRTNLEISAIGFGGIPIQKVDKETAIELIKKAKEEGINFIDTAKIYGRSEELIGYGVEETGRENWILATKSPERDYDAMKKDIERSLELMKTDYIDLYQLHNVRTDDQYDKVMSEDGALKALKEAQKQGKIKHIGITSHDLGIIERALDDDIFSTIQFPYNPVETQASEIFDRAHKMDVGVIVMKPVAGGAIRNVDLSLRFILENSNISVVIPGMNEVKHIESNAAIGNNYKPLTDEERDIILGEAKELGTEFCRRCGYCAPCPQGIDIPVQFIVEGYYTRYDLKDWAKERYATFEHKANECVECGICETRCPYDLPIRKMLKRVHKNLG
ncbi:aldo/keto reductase [Clostridiisalibacter paucivorans]|uniref:aldo/keto reductase n=1 Tax=Clostridiisalibacter paucivorans TaxID=408753 RepID=UPI00047EEECB|nr:aldo/keto reductase [Clostridiisalibacter paucivorans]